MPHMLLVGDRAPSWALIKWTREEPPTGEQSGSSGDHLHVQCEVSVLTPTLIVRKPVAEPSLVPNPEPKHMLGVQCHPVELDPAAKAWSQGCGMQNSKGRRSVPKEQSDGEKEASLAAKGHTSAGSGKSLVGRSLSGSTSSCHTERAQAYRKTCHTSAAALDDRKGWFAASGTGAFMQAVPEKLQGKVDTELACRVALSYLSLEESKAVSATAIESTFTDLSQHLGRRRASTGEMDGRRCPPCVHGEPGQQNYKGDLEHSGGRRRVPDKIATRSQCRRSIVATVGGATASGTEG